MPRESGYKVTIEGFIPTPKNDFDKQAEIASALSRATKPGGNVADVVALIKDAQVFASATSRTAPATDADASSGPVSEAEEEATPSGRRSKAAA